MKLTPSQLGVLDTLATFHPVAGVEVRLPPSMDGTRKIKLECHLMNATTLAKLESAGLVAVQRDDWTRPKDAIGKNGHARRTVTIEITDAGRSALAKV